MVVAKKSDTQVALMQPSKQFFLILILSFFVPCWTANLPWNSNISKTVRVDITFSIFQALKKLN